MKSFSVKRDARPLVIRVSIAALLTFAAVWWGSAGLASKRLVPESVQQPPSRSGNLDDQPTALEEPETRRAEMEKSAAYCPFGVDTDVLDMSGDWTLTYGYIPGFTVDASRHWAPVGSPRSYRVHFDLIGPGDHGGMKFKGYFIGGPPAAISGETFYDGRGVHIVQMLVKDYNHPGRYYELLSGAHSLYTIEEPTRVEVKGGWVNVGNSGCGIPGAGSGYVANFVMVKD